MLNFIFTIDGDWGKYFDTDLPDKERKPKEARMKRLIEAEMALASRYLSGKFIHFVHTSPRARDFFLRPDFIDYWKKIEDSGGNIGVHCHEDDPEVEYHFDDIERMDVAISGFTRSLKASGLHPISYRGGFMTFDPRLIPILEKNGLHLDFSCDPNRYRKHDDDSVVSDWRGAPNNFYRMNYSDHRKRGKSKVFEIPLGKAHGISLYPEVMPLFSIWKLATKLKKRSKSEVVIVSVLAHSYDFNSRFAVLKIKLTIMLLKIFGKFINPQEALGIIKENH